MAGYEQTIIVGNVGRTPEHKTLDSGKELCSFSVAVTTRWNDRQSNEKREKTNWYKVTCWDKLAGLANQLVSKGAKVMIVGTVEARAYTGNDGDVRASLELRADSFTLLSGRNDDEETPPMKDNNDIPF